MTGAAFGAITRDVAGLVEGNAALAETIREIGGADGLIEAFLDTALGMVGLAVAGYQVSAVLRLRTEETSGLAEPLLALPIPRTRWAGGHVVVSLIWSSVLLLVLGATIALTDQLRGGSSGIGAGDIVLAAAAQVPAGWVLGGLCLLLIGWLPRASGLAWAVLAVAVLLGFLGELLQLPRALIDLSPFAHVPGVGEWSATPVLVLTAIALAAAALGLVGLRRRNIG